MKKDKGNVSQNLGLVLERFPCADAPRAQIDIRTCFALILGQGICGPYRNSRNEDKTRKEGKARALDRLAGNK